MFNPEFLATDNNEGHEANALIQYLQDQPADVLQRVAKSASPEIQEIIRQQLCPPTPAHAHRLALPSACRHST